MGMWVGLYFFRSLLLLHLGMLGEENLAVLPRILHNFFSSFRVRKNTIALGYTISHTYTST